MNNQTPEISIITVTHNSAPHIAEQIRSVILGCDQISFEHIIVDNASTDETNNIISEHFPNVVVIKKQHNVGFSRANNDGARLAQGKYLLFLNPDMRVSPQSLGTIIEWIKKLPNVGIASCKLVSPAGAAEERGIPRRFPKFWEQLLVVLKVPHIFPSILNRYLYSGFDFSKEQAVESVRGSFLLMRRELYQQMGRAFDERYFIWFEDVDTCREAKRLGFEVMYTPVIQCVDLIGQSFEKKNFLWKQWQYIVSMSKYFWKWKFKMNY